MNKKLELLDFSKMKFDIIIAAGQSNCEGCGHGEVDAPFEPKDNIWYMNKNFTISTAKEKVVENSVVGAFKLIFADEYCKNGNLEPNRQLIIIDSPVGGTGFEKGMWGKNEPLTTNMLSMTKTVLNLNPENKVVAFLWHQGERSINFNLTPDFHMQSLRILIDEVQSEFGNKFPLIAGDFVPLWKETKGEQGILIEQAIRQVFCNEYNGGFVESTGLTSNAADVSYREDDIHFSRKSCYELGKRYYKVFAQQIANNR